MAIFDDIYWEKGTEKYFYTLEEIERAAQSAVEKHIENRNVLKKLKHFFKSNQTVIEIDKELREDYEVKSKDKKPLEHARILSDSLIQSRFCCKVADFKNKEMESYYKHLEREYKKLSSEYIKSCFANIVTVKNWVPVRQALAVQSGFGKDVHAELIRIENIILIQNVYKEIEKSLASLKYKYEREVINRAKDLFTSISQYEFKDEYKPIFDVIGNQVLTSYKTLTEQIESKIEKENKQKQPSINALVKLMKEYQGKELDFETFSSSYNNRKYDQKIEDLQQLSIKLFDLADNEEKTYERICNGKDELTVIIESAKRIDTISSLLDGLTQNYKEIVKEKVQLEKLRLLYKQNIAHLLEAHLTTTGDTLNNTLCSIEDVPKWLSLFKEYTQFKDKLQSVDFLSNKLNEFSGKHIENMQSFITNYQYNYNEFDEYIREQKLLKSYLESSEFNFTKEIDIQQLESEGANFHTELNEVSSAIVSINKAIADEKISSIENDYNLLTRFVRDYENSRLLQYEDLKAAYCDIRKSIDAIVVTMSDVIDKLAYVGDLCLFNPNTNRRYLFITGDELEFGRAVNAQEFYRSGKLFIPLASISGKHGSLNTKTMIYSDKGSTNGSYSAQSTVRKERIDLSQGSDLNFALQLTFDVVNHPNFAVLKLSWFDRGSENLIRFHNSTQEFIEFWGKLHIIIVKSDAYLYISKLNGDVYDSVDDENNFYRIEYNNYRYNFTDSQVGVHSESVMKKGNVKLPLLIEEI